MFKLTLALIFTVLIPNFATADQSSAGKGKANQSTASQSAAQPIFAVAADENQKSPAVVDLPQEPKDEPPVVKNDKPIHPYGADIHYDSWMWILVFVMPFASAYFLISAIRTYFKTRNRLLKETSLDNITLPRSKMGPERN